MMQRSHDKDSYIRVHIPPNNSIKKWIKPVELY